MALEIPKPVKQIKRVSQKVTQNVTHKVAKRVSLGNVAALLIATALIGQVLGFLRVKLINNNFTDAGANDAGVYFAATNIPDFFFFTIAAGALGVTVMPFLSDRLHAGDRRGMWQLSNSILNLLGMVTLVVGLFLFVFAQPLIHYFFKGLDPAQLENATALMRWLSLNPFLFTISGILATAQQTLGRFFFFAIAPLSYNISIIISIFLFKDTSLGIVGLGVGAFVGAILQLLVVIVGLVGTKYHWRPVIAWRNTDFRAMLGQLPTRSLDQGMDQVQSLVDTSFASRLGGANAIATYSNAYVLHTAPTLLIGTAISTAAFPRMNERLSQGKYDLFRKDFLRILRAMIWIIMPVIVVCYFGRGYLARMIFSNNAPDIALILGFLTGAILFRTLYAIISRWFYSQKDSMTPLVVSVFTIGFNIWLAYILSRPDAYGLAGLALAQSIVAAVEVAILSIIMLVRDHKLFDREFWGGVWRIVSITGFSMVAGSTMVALYPLGIQDGALTVTTKLFFITLVTFTVHVGLSSLFGLEEVRPFFARAKKIFKLVLKPIKM